MTDVTHLAPEIEVARPGFSRGDFRVALLDFDGTLSLLRGNWQGVMIPPMVEALAATPRAESRAALQNLVEDFVHRLTGRPTLDQMLQFADEMERRGGTRPDPEAEKERFLDELLRAVNERIAAVRAGHRSRHEFAVPGAAQLVETLHARGLTLYLASGTDLDRVELELDVLGLGEFFGPRVFGPAPGVEFSKGGVIRRLLAETGITGRQLLGIGDGYVEIAEVKAVGGTAVGVASDEVHIGCLDESKRRRLIDAGTDIVVAEYSRLDELLTMLGIG